MRRLFFSSSSSKSFSSVLFAKIGVGWFFWNTFVKYSACRSFVVSFACRISASRGSKSTSHAPSASTELLLVHPRQHLRPLEPQPRGASDHRQAGRGNHRTRRRPRGFAAGVQQFLVRRRVATSQTARRPTDPPCRGGCRASWARRGCREGRRRCSPARRSHSSDCRTASPPSSSSIRQLGDPSSPSGPPPSLRRAR